MKMMMNKPRWKWWTQTFSESATPGQYFSRCRPTPEIDVIMTHHYKGGFEISVNRILLIDGSFHDFRSIGARHVEGTSLSVKRKAPTIVREIILAAKEKHAEMMDRLERELQAGDCEKHSALFKRSMNNGR